MLTKQHPAYATTINNLGLLYDSLGKYELSEKYYIECLEIRKNV